MKTRALWDGRSVTFKKIKSRYEIRWDPPIGRGAYGKVVEAIDKQSKQVCPPNRFSEAGLRS